MALTNLSISDSCIINLSSINLSSINNLHSNPKTLDFRLRCFDQLYFLSSSVAVPTSSHLT